MRPYSENSSGQRRHQALSTIRLRTFAQRGQDQIGTNFFSHHPTLSCQGITKEKEIL